VPRPSPNGLSLAALVIAVAALAVALSGGAIGLPGKRVIDKNDLAKNVVKSKHVKNGQLKLGDLSKGAKTALDDPRAYALVTGPGEVDEDNSRGISDDNVIANNSVFLHRGDRVRAETRAGDAAVKPR
jgi:hypothetical protein